MEMTRYIFKIIKLSVLFCLISNLEAGAVTYLNGAAELSYVNYEAEAEGKKIYSGDSFAQKYSINWGATNYLRPTQPQYYKLLLGYDWMAFDTDTTEGAVSKKISDAYGKFRYSGTVGYQPAHLPIRFNAYVTDDITPVFRRNISQGLTGDDLYFDVDNKYKGQQSGVMFVFEPERSYSASLRSLPRLHLDYRETVNKSDSGFTAMNNKSRELAVAGLNKENNWLHYRNFKFENFLNSADNFEQQQIQIGLIDYVGRRKWSALTNWINVSADGQLTTRQNTTDFDNLEEYDINFHAIATRRLWDARTFMNYNRELRGERLTERTSVPLYVKGLWGRDTNWFVNVNESRSRQQLDTGGEFSKAYQNTLSMGFTTFKQSSFTLSPSLLLSTDKTYNSGDGYRAEVGVSSNSTARFSKVHALSAAYTLKLRDDGLGTSASSFWNQKLRVRDRYRAGREFVAEAEQVIENGSGTEFVDIGRLENSANSDNARQQNFIRSITKLSVAWNKSAELRNTFGFSYDIIKAQGYSPNTELLLSHEISYELPTTTVRVNSRYMHREFGSGAFSDTFDSSGSAEYRPDRYNSASLRYIYYDINDQAGNSKQVEVKQKYDRLFYSRTGVMRTIATLSQEYSRIYTTNRENSVDSQYLLLSGRYSPTSRLTLYGSTRFQKEPGAFVMFYNAGLNVDFKLLATSLDYTVATRDSDKRTEKKLFATMTRNF